MRIPLSDPHRLLMAPRDSRASRPLSLRRCSLSSCHRNSSISGETEIFAQLFLQRLVTISAANCASDELVNPLSSSSYDTNVTVHSRNCALRCLAYSPARLLANSGLDTRELRYNLRCVQRGEIGDMASFPAHSHQSQSYSACGHGNWRWAWAPSDKWSCEYYHSRHIREELVPEIRCAHSLDKEKGETLRLLTLTAEYEDSDGDPTAAGAKRRTKILQRLSQSIRRKWGDFEYLKVAGLTKRGRVHTHLVAIMPYINQKAISAFWKKTTGGSYVVDVEAVGMKCSKCWPGRSAPRFRKKKLMIIPPPGNGSCQNCGYEPDNYDEVAS